MSAKKKNSLPDSPLLLQPHQLLSEWPHMLFVFLVVLIAYLCTMAKEVTWEDSPLLTMGSYFVSPAHAPGYPLFCMIGKVFTFLPIGTVAFRVALVSVIFAAFTCVILWWLARSLIPGRAPAYAVAFCYAFSREFWRQSTIVEVYSFNTFFFFLLVALCLQIRERGGTTLILFTAFVFGLSASNHIPLMMLSTPCLVLIVLPRYRELIPKLPHILVCIFIGLFPYLVMCWRSTLNLPFNFYGPLHLFEPASSGDSLLYYLSRRGFKNADVAVPPATWMDKWMFADYQVKLMMVQFSVVGCALALWGFALQTRRWAATVSGAFILGMVGSSFVLIGLLKMAFIYNSKTTYMAYPLIPYGIMSLWLGLAMHQIFSLSIFAKAGEDSKRSWFVTGSVIMIVFCSNYSSNQKHNFHGSSDYTQMILRPIDDKDHFFEKGAILIFNSPFEELLLGYQHLVEGVRPDIDMYRYNGMVFNNRFCHPRDTRKVQLEKRNNFISQHLGQRPIYTIGEIEHSFKTRHFGLYEQIIPDQDTATGKEVTLSTDTLNYIQTIALYYNRSDHFAMSHRHSIMTMATKALTRAVYLQGTDKVVDANVEKCMQHVSQSFSGAFWRVQLLADSEFEDKQQLIDWLDEAETLPDVTDIRIFLAIMYDIRGVLLMNVGKIDSALWNFENSVSFYPDKDNNAVVNLLQLYSMSGNTDAFWTLRKKIYANTPLPVIVQEMENKLETENINK